MTAVLKQALCVLIIGHDVDMAHRLGDTVEQAGHDVDFAYDARSGLDAARRLRPDAVFVELAPPLLDGCQVARRLRAEPATRDALIVALTAATPESDLQSLREAGFDQRMVNPAESQVVRSLLGALAPMPAR